MIWILLFAYIMQIMFGFDEIFVSGLNQVLGTNFEKPVYWIFVVIMSFILQIIYFLRKHR